MKVWIVTSHCVERFIERSGMTVDDQDRVEPILQALLAEAETRMFWKPGQQALVTELGIFFIGQDNYLVTFLSWANISAVRLNRVVELNMYHAVAS